MKNVAKLKHSNMVCFKVNLFKQKDIVDSVINFTPNSVRLETAPTGGVQIFSGFTIKREFREDCWNGFSQAWQRCWVARGVQWLRPALTVHEPLLRTYRRKHRVVEGMKHEGHIDEFSIGS